MFFSKSVRFCAYFLIAVCSAAVASSSQCDVGITLSLQDKRKEIKSTLSLQQKSNAFLTWAYSNAGATAESRCKDDALFVDDQGYKCVHWRAYNCSLAHSFYGYSAREETRLQSACPEACESCCDCQQHFEWHSTMAETRYVELIKNNRPVEVAFTVTDECGNTATEIGVFTTALAEREEASAEAETSSGISDDMYLIGTVCLGFASIGLVILAVHVRRRRSGSHDFNHRALPQIQLADDYIYDEYEGTALPGELPVDPNGNTPTVHKLTAVQLSFSTSCDSHSPENHADLSNALYS
eukprot:m.137924 g.137924  ORF g.137924 m.137924 type:complete len:297 (+) comp17587_c0_seq4:262-1152(+)